MKEKPNKKVLFWQVKETNGHGSKLKWIPGQNKESILSTFTNPDQKIEMIRATKIPLGDLAFSEYPDQYNFLFEKDGENITIEPNDSGHDYLNQYYKEVIAKKDSSGE
ncbi:MULTISPECIES: hypothetical protein [Pseudomonas]|uniref:hypothetical protein n=1 Tax=Pseudomonas TaxID=286 RepID=UPI000876BF1E|nr:MULTISPECIES: hypothetical protein [Pseudomonas]SCZ38213.1 hypothetical protein SAMN03159313_4767 [Pseudomonas sp. NFIX46]SDB46563.1 hypothetical protein SAMN03097715_03450 [Pseudomonas putida]SFQ91828.1 hypothetical protein SAMN03159312_4590 [Pseudomonas sp. NFIX49]